MHQHTFTFKPIEEPADKKPTPRIFTVSEIVGGARALIESTFGDVWVVGEVSRFTRHSSGHSYFTLKDANSVIPAAIFRGSFSAVKFEIKDGLELICHGKLSLYQKGGQYQIIVDYVEPKGVGELQLAFEQLKKKLHAEGLFEKARKRPIPFMPQKIGIVTSPTGAAIRDMLKVALRRFPGVDILIVPVRVQGDGAAGEIAEGIKLLNQRDDVDVMIIGRGGGSIEDLWAFNEEIVARAIFTSRIPVISAVGHEIDFTISDFVADLRAPTPSAAAEHAVPVRDELAQYIMRVRSQLGGLLQRNIKNRIDRVVDLKNRLKPPTSRFPEYYRYMDGLKERMTYSMQVGVKQRENAFRSLMAELNHLSPLAVLSKGYSVVTMDGGKKVIKSASEVHINDVVEVRFNKGTAEARIEKLETL